jgi:hypothetical protein
MKGAAAVAGSLLQYTLTDFVAYRPTVEERHRGGTRGIDIKIHVMSTQLSPTVNF